MGKYTKKQLRSHVLSLLAKANAPYNKIVVQEDQMLDCFVNIQWDINNNLNITYSNLINHIDEAFLKDLLEKELEHYLEHLNQIK